MDAYLVIDVSKGYADFTLLDSNKKQLEEVFQLDDTRLGHDCLKKQLQEMIKEYCKNNNITPEPRANASKLTTAW